MVDPIKLEHFRNLVSLCAADGKIEPAERESLIAIADSVGIPYERLEVMLDHAHDYIYLVPQNNTDRDKQLEEMLDMAFVDGTFAASERTLVRNVAQKLGFTDEAAEQFITDYIQRRVPPAGSNVTGGH